MKNSFCYGFIVFRKKTDDNFEFLLIKNSKGHFDFPKGHKDVEDKSKLDTAKRETLEETNLSDLNIIDNFSVCIDYVIPGQNTHKFVELFLAEYISGEVVLSDEHTEFVWCDFDTALKLLSFDNYKSSLISAFNFLKFTS